MNEYRNFTCGQLRAADAGKRVRLAGWVHRKRNLGNLCFVDLRDHYGITQCVFDSASPLFEKMQGIRVESVIGIDGEAVILDLRKERIHKNILLRSAVIERSRQLMREQGFTEYQTPILTASSPDLSQAMSDRWIMPSISSFRPTNKPNSVMFLILPSMTDPTGCSST